MTKEWQNIRNVGNKIKTIKFVTRLSCKNSFDYEQVESTNRENREKYDFFSFVNLVSR